MVAMEDSLIVVGMTVVALAIIGLCSFAIYKSYEYDRLCLDKGMVWVPVTNNVPSHWEYPTRIEKVER